MSAFDSIAALSNAALLGVFGGPVSFVQAPAAAFTLSVIWSGADGQPQGLTAWCRRTDFPLLLSGERMEPRKGDVVTRGNYTYRLSKMSLRDGTEGITMYLELTGQVTP